MPNIILFNWPYNIIYLALNIKNERDTSMVEVISITLPRKQLVAYKIRPITL